MSKHVHITVLTYNRPDDLNNLLRDLEREPLPAGYTRTVWVYNDGGEAPRVPEGARLINRGRNYGKEKHWQLITHIWQNLPDADYFIQLPDDFRIRPGGLRAMVQQWENLRAHDPRAVCLNPFLDRSRIGRPNWTQTIPTIAKFEGYYYLRTQWNDLAFIASKDFFRLLAHRVSAIPLERWKQDARLSSGVGKDISIRLAAKNKNLYQVRESLVDHVGDDSKMNPAERRETALHSGSLDRIVAGMATIPGRERSFRRAVDSILPQVDELHIVYNGFGELPPPIDRGKVRGKIFEWYTGGTRPEIKDRGDANKFFGIETGINEPFYFFSLDDDIIYPPGYVWHLIREIEDRNRRAVVGYHGKVMKNSPIGSFYDRNARKAIYHCRAEVQRPQAVNLIGTGCLAYHSDTCPDWNAGKCAEPNMADIWFSRYCQERGIPMYVVPHKPLAVDTSIADTIFDRGQRDATAPTRAFNLYKDWRVIK